MRTVSTNCIIINHSSYHTYMMKNGRVKNTSREYQTLEIRAQIAAGDKSGFVWGFKVNLISDLNLKALQPRFTTYSMTTGETQLKT